MFLQIGLIVLVKLSAKNAILIVGLAHKFRLCRLTFSAVDALTLLEVQGRRYESSIRLTQLNK